MQHLIIKTVFSLVMIALAVFYIYVMRYRSSLRIFRHRVRQGDWVLLRVGTDLVRVLVVRRGSPGIVLVKQEGRKRKTLFVSVSNLYPIPEK